MNNAQDLCVKYRRDWNRAEKAIACHHLSKADRAMNERVLDRADDFLFTARPESLTGAGALVQHGATALAGAITFELRHALFSIGARLLQGKSSLASSCAQVQADVVALRRAIAACECEPDAMEAGELDVMEAGYKADVMAMLRRALDFMKRPQLV